MLAPAKTARIGMEAIRAGADAVYIGAPRYGARAAAGNSIEEIRQLCDYAHRYGASVYAALNTILYNEELDDARRLALELADCGVDALIVQDPALLQFDLPLPLHASTQMDNRTVRDVERLYRLGFAQAVLARELTLEQIGEIHERVPIALEVFVHGALCVSYSGRCYASQACFGRSANRGECAQFCRLAFDLEDAEGGKLMEKSHLLSLRDMNRSRYLEQLIDAGASSLKIEGRLKDAGYVKNVTAYYRRRIDELLIRRDDLCRSSFGRSAAGFEPNLGKTFNRRYTDYFLHGRTPDMASHQTPAFVGEKVGRVRAIGRGRVEIAVEQRLNNGDGLSYFDGDGVLRGFRANRVDGSTIYLAPEEQGTKGLREGMQVYRNRDARFMRQVEQSMQERTLWLDFRLSRVAVGFCLEVITEMGTRVELQFESDHRGARTPCRDRIEGELRKLGGTGYRARKVELAFEGDYFLPAARVAEWRRRIVAQLEIANRQAARNRREEQLAECRARAAKWADENKRMFEGERLDYSRNVSNREAEAFYKERGAAEVSEAFELQPQEGAVLMTCKYCLLYELGRCKREHNQHFKEPLSLRLSDGRRFALRFDCRRCEMELLNVGRKKFEKT